MSSEDLNVVALVKGSERYVFVFNDANRSQVLRTLGRYASNPELSLTWYDAAVLSQKVRKGDDQQSTSVNRLLITNGANPINDDPNKP